MLQQMHHPAIMAPHRMVQRFAVNHTLDELFITFPLMGPSLRELLFKAEQPLPLTTVRTYATDLLSALAYLHSRGVIRRTLQLDKLLVTPDGQHLKLNNFQQSRQYAPMFGAVVRGGDVLEEANVTNSPPIAYNLCYCPPELLLGQKSDTHDWGVDSWHAGCMIGAMLKGEPVFFGESKVAQMMHIFKCVLCVCVSLSVVLLLRVPVFVTSVVCAPWLAASWGSQRSVTGRA